MKKTIISDSIAALTVSFAAISLGAAFGIMSGRGAFAGMLGAAIIPIITSIFGGTRIQASGPTAPMTAVTAVIVAKAYDSFPGDQRLADEFITLVILLAAFFIIITGLLKLGKLIQIVPQVVILGFMNGIALLIWIDQLKKLFALNATQPLKGDFELNIAIAFSTLGLIYFFPILFKKLKVPLTIRRFFPSIFLTIGILTLITTYFNLNVEHVTLGDGYSTFTEYLRVVWLDLPLNASLFNSDLLLIAIPLALQLCLLSYLDSLLTSLVIDKLMNEKTAPNKELIAQGVANGITGILQGIPGAQATIRSVLLIKEGAQTRLAGVLVGVFVLTGFLFLGQYITLISSAVFVGVLLKAGLDVLDRDFPITFITKKWYLNRERNFQALLIIYTSIVTVIIDLNVAVITGTILFYVSKRLKLMQDVEADFSDVVSEELLGAPIETTHVPLGEKAT
jgi:sulfate permease, SulP family